MTTVNIRIYQCIGKTGRWNSFFFTGHNHMVSTRIKGLLFWPCLTFENISIRKLDSPRLPYVHFCLWLAKYSCLNIAVLRVPLLYWWDHSNHAAIIDEIVLNLVLSVRFTRKNWFWCCRRWNLNNLDHNFLRITNPVSDLTAGTCSSIWFFEVAIIEITIQFFKFVCEILPIQPTIQARAWHTRLPSKMRVEIFR
jgi:hypothetical protein